MSYYPYKAFKSDSQHLAVSLRSSIAKRCSHLNAALCAKAKCLHQSRKVREKSYYAKLEYAFLIT
ncbi:hypothetical protein C9I91_22285 [Photobacterium jeanii]|nr:hypothetical protein C9I91_22285 [Photobacterium jeanii]